MTDTAQPNIILIQADQLSALALPSYGNTTTICPQIDDLAENGVVFENMYCNFPLCSPSRSSMMTGLLASKIGAYDNGAELKSSIPTFAHYLRDLGYRTCLSGKMHFVGPDQLHGFEDRLTSDIYPADFQWAANWNAAKHTDVTDTRGVTKSGLCEDSVQLRYDRTVTKNAVSYLKDHATGDDNRPLLMTVSYTHPHDPFVCQPEHWHLYDNHPIEMPKVGPLPDDQIDPHSRKILTQAGLLDVEFTTRQIRNARRGYFGSISFLDDQIKALRDGLETTGMADNTIVIITSDHGEMLGERGMWFKKNFYEPAMRVPLIVHAPARFAPARVSTPVSLVDLMPTLTTLGAGEHTPQFCEPLDGRNLVPMMQGQKEPETPPVLAEILSEGVTQPAFMILSGHWKYIHFGIYPAQLFNLEEDPQELSDLAADPAQENRVAKFGHQVSNTWDETALARHIRIDQDRRSLIQRSFGKGRYSSWDYDAGDVTQSDWFRGQTSYNEWAFDYVPSHDPDGTNTNKIPKGEI
ncbi:MAG: choline-sulfatase [Sulfitobacter sp.]